MLHYYSLAPSKSYPSSQRVLFICSIICDWFFDACSAWLLTGWHRIPVFVIEETSYCRSCESRSSFCRLLPLFSYFWSFKYIDKILLLSDWASDAESCWSECWVCWLLSYSVSLFSFIYSSKTSTKSYRSSTIRCEAYRLTALELYYRSQERRLNVDRSSLSVCSMLFWIRYLSGTGSDRNVNNLFNVCRLLVCESSGNDKLLPVFWLSSLVPLDRTILMSELQLVLKIISPLVLFWLFNRD